MDRCLAKDGEWVELADEGTENRFWLIGHKGVIFKSIVKQHMLILINSTSSQAAVASPCSQVRHCPVVSDWTRPGVCSLNIFEMSYSSPRRHPPRSWAPLHLADGIVGHIGDSISTRQPLFQRSNRQLTWVVLTGQDHNRETLRLACQSSPGSIYSKLNERVVWFDLRQFPHRPSY